MHILKVGCKNEVDFIREMTHSYGKIMISQSPEKISLVMEKELKWHKRTSTGKYEGKVIDFFPIVDSN